MRAEETTVIETKPVKIKRANSRVHAAARRADLLTALGEDVHPVVKRVLLRWFTVCGYEHRRIRNDVDLTAGGEIRPPGGPYLKDAPGEKYTCRDCIDRLGKLQRGSA